MDENMQSSGMTPEQPSMPAPIVPQPQAGPTFSLQDVEANKYIAALSYLWLLFLVPLLVKKDSPYAQFHAKQGLVIAMAFIVGWVIFWIPFIGWLASVVLIVVDVMALIKTLQGKTWEIPVVKDVVKKLNI